MRASARRREARRPRRRGGSRRRRRTRLEAAEHGDARARGPPEMAGDPAAARLHMAGVYFISPRRARGGPGAAPGVSGRPRADALGRPARCVELLLAAGPSRRRATSGRARRRGAVGDAGARAARAGAAAPTEGEGAARRRGRRARGHARVVECAAQLLRGRRWGGRRAFRTSGAAAGEWWRSAGGRRRRGRRARRAVRRARARRRRRQHMLTRPSSSPSGSVSCVLLVFVLPFCRGLSPLVWRAVCRGLPHNLRHRAGRARRRRPPAAAARFSALTRPSTRVALAGTSTCRRRPARRRSSTPRARDDVPVRRELCLCR